MTQHDLLVAVPSRGRPHNIARLITALTDTVADEVYLVVGLDRDDPCLQEYLSLPVEGMPGGVEFVIEDDLHQVVAWINRLVVPRVDEFKFIGFIGDDHVPKTKGWDVMVRDSLKRQRIGMCYGDDGYPLRPKGALATYIFVTSEIVKALGFMTLPTLSHMFCDDYWTTLGRATSIEFLPQMLMKHEHNSLNSDLDDATYEAANACMQEDQRVFIDYCRTGLANDIAKVKSLGER